MERKKIVGKRMQKDRHQEETKTRRGREVHTALCGFRGVMDILLCIHTLQSMSQSPLSNGRCYWVFILLVFSQSEQHRPGGCVGRLGGRGQLAAPTTSPGQQYKPTPSLFYSQGQGVVGVVRAVSHRIVLPVMVEALNELGRKYKSRFNSETLSFAILSSKNIQK